MASALIGADQMMKAAAAAAAAAGQHHLVTHPYHHHHHHAAHHGTYHHPHLIHYQSSTNEFIAQQSHYIQDIVSAPSAAESSAPAPTRSVSPESPTNPEDDEVEDEEKIFGSKADLQLHTQIHMRESKPYKCSQCSKSFANSSYLSQHSRIHLGVKPYRCEICQRKFTQLSHLQQHVRTHTGDKPYKCRHPTCTKAFSQLSNLQSHSRCHQTDKPYKCNACYKCFPDEAALLEHIPKHKESKHLKTHICQFCGKSYTQETYLAKHMQKHTEREGGGASTGRNSGGKRLSRAAAAAAAAAADQVNNQQNHQQQQQQQYWVEEVKPNECIQQQEIQQNSAFTPIQAVQMVAPSAANPTATRTYFPYDPLGAFAVKTSPAAAAQAAQNAFNNQLISLHQIKNYHAVAAAAHHHHHNNPAANLMLAGTANGPCGTIDFSGLSKDK